MSKKKCRNCGARIIEYPIWKGQEFGEPFAFNKINWRNLIIGDWTKLVIMITLLLVAWSYMHDTQVVRDIYENPCDFVNKNKFACVEMPEAEGSTKLVIGENLPIRWVPINITA